MNAENTLQCKNLFNILDKTYRLIPIFLFSQSQKIFIMSSRLLLKKPLQIVVTMLLFFAFTLKAKAQTIQINTETFPNYTVLSGFPGTQTFVGSIGTWSATVNQSYADVDVLNYTYRWSSPNALRIVNNAGSAASTAVVTSPNIDLSAYSCSQKAWIDFGIYTGKLANSSCVSYKIEFSNNGGSTWTSVMNQTSAQILASYSNNSGWNDKYIAITSTYLVSNFKYRITGTQNAGCGLNNEIWFDDFTINADRCPPVLTNCSTGSFNPAASAQLYNVFVQQGVTFNNGHVDGAVALGGDLTLDGSTNIAMSTSGSYPNGYNNNDNYGLVVGSRMYYTSGGISYVNRGALRLGSGTGSNIWYTDPNNAAGNLRVTSNASSGFTSYNSTPALYLQRSQASPTATQSNGLNFTTAFSTMLSNANTMAAYTSTSTCSASLNILYPSGTTPSITLVSGKTNVINVNGSDLTAVTSLNFTNKPTATSPLVINVNQTGNLNWTPYSVTGLSIQDAQYIIYNFYNCTGTIYVDGANQFLGTIFAPQAAFTWNNSNNLEGQLITKSALICNGEIHENYFNACLPNCTPTLSLGNRVFYDTNNNGYREDAENGIANVTVNLYKDDNNDNVADGSAIATATTDASGFYLFTGLAAGNYIVGVVTPAGYMSSSVNGGDPDNDIDRDDNGQVTVGNETRGLGITLALYTEPDGTNTNTNTNITYDFGFLPDCGCTTSPSNLLVNGSFENGTTGWSWNSSNGNLTTGTGYIACGNANGFNNWTANGASTVWQDVVVGAGSVVTFSAYAGTHTAGLSCSPTLSLIFLNSSNAVIGQTNVAVTRDVDVNNNQLAYYSITATAPAGTVKARVQSSISCNTMKMDAFCLTATNPNPVNLGNLVWNDINNNGVRDSGEPGIAGATVRLYIDANNDNVPDGTPIATTTTDANGVYNFTGLYPNNYIVGVVIPTGYSVVTTNGGDPDNNIDNDNNGTNTNNTQGEVRSNAITLTVAGEPDTAVDGDGTSGNLTLDFAFVQPCTAPSQLVTNGNFNTASVTGFNTDVPSGSYGFNTNAYNANNTWVSDGDRTTGTGNLMWFSDDQTPISNRRSWYQTYSTTLGTTYTFSVWVRNVLNTATNPTLYLSVDGVQVGTSVTPTFANGWVLLRATYTAPTTANRVFAIVLSANNVYNDYAIDDVSINACSAAILKLGNLVWWDVNGNGLKDTNEPGVAGATVKLYADANSDNVPDAVAIATTTTDANGNYSFSNLFAGNYIVGVTMPTGYVPTSTTVNSSNPNSDTDNDNNGVTTVGSELRSNYITLSAGNEPATAVDGDDTNGNLTLDFGLKGTLNLGNLVWNDTNTDGDYDQYEPGVGAVSVLLYRDANGDNVADGAAIATTTTNAQGIYNFTGLIPGNYIVGMVIPAGYIRSNLIATSNNPNNDVNDDNNGFNLLGANVAGTEVRSNFITLSIGGEPTTDGDGNNGNLTLDFGLCGLGGLGDFVWNDQNKNGLQDANELGIAGVLVTLTYPDGTQLTVPTDADGYYFYPNLGPGNYVVTFATPLGMTPTLSNQGANDAIDSDPIAGVVNVTLGVSEVNSTVDAGFYLQTCTPVVGPCGAGSILKNTNFVQNGTFATTAITPINNTFSGTNATSAASYSFTGGSFKAQAQQTTGGSNVYPGAERHFNIQQGIFNNSSYSSACLVQSPFPGDPANRVASANNWLYHNGNDLGGSYLVWEQSVTGLVIGQTYVFRFYASNVINTTCDVADPIISLNIGGTSGLPNGTQVIAPVTLDESSTSETQALKGWRRFAYTFTATATNQTFKIIDAQTATNGDDLGITAIGIDICLKDTDGDCIADVDDIDDDNDGITDVNESGGCDPLLDTDGDGIPDYKDSDSPGCKAWLDCNNDGINDNYDWDRDGIINELDLDSDNDGILDVQEARAGGVDNNKDGMIDGTDADGNGLMSTADNGSGFTNPAANGLQAEDLDRDGTPNYLDLDSDGDGINDLTEALEVYDADGIVASGIASPVDGDNDGVRGNTYNGLDATADNFNGFGAKGVKLKDRDGDGKPNPYDIDSDNDGITDNVEGQPTCSEQQPSGNDCDGDGVDDKYDLTCNICVRAAGGINPFDKDNDGIPDIYDLDTDNDGVPDVNEGSGLSGNFVTNFNDTDGDGLIDQFDVFNIKTATSNFKNNVAHSQMGPNGNFDGPVPPGSNVQVIKSQPGDCSTYDRDWREVTILPVTLISFTGNLYNNITNLQWKVTNEVNLDRYEVERSIDGVNYSKIGTTTAKGSIAATNYTLPDNISSLTASIVYYRLKMIDKAGTHKYSNVITFKLNGKKTQVDVNPNPAVNFFSVKINAIKDGMASIRLVDIAGKVLAIQNVSIQKGSNTIMYNNISQYAAGTYLVQVQMSGEVFSEKLIITK
jgi:choice-of-anchor A domain-containing protein